MSDKQPRLGVALVVFHEGKLILGRRARGANAGRWVLPGGGVELGEHWRVAGAREFLEETGLSVAVYNNAPDYVMEIIGGDSHRVCLVVAGHLIGAFEEMGPSYELSEVGAFTLEDVERLDLSKPVRTCLEALGYISPPEDTCESTKPGRGYGWSPQCDSPSGFPCACGATHT